MPERPAPIEPPTLTGARVRLRPWADADLAPFAAMNADPEVTRFLMAPLTREQSDAFALRARADIEADGHGLWALEVPKIGFAGFVGLSSRVPFELTIDGIAPNPREIGWRLTRAAWGHGYATEAATLALRHAFDAIGLTQVVSFTARGNLKSRAVMERIGLTLRGEFDHPKLAEGHPLRRHVLHARDAAPGGDHR